MNAALMDILPLAAKGYCCSQIMVLLSLEDQGHENPELVRALSGLCHGMGLSGGVCGILTGGCCALGLYVGKGADAETPHEMAELVQDSYVQWFTEKATSAWGGITCAAILGEEGGGKPDMARCGDLLAAARGRVLELLAEYGLDPTEAKRG